MIIKTLVEDTSVSPEYRNEHGFSLYIETKKHKILFDLGASDLFLENAKKMNVDIKNVDLVIISHGHYDHGGGLNAFLQNNSKAKIYIHNKAFEGHFSNRNNGISYIGIDDSLKSNNRIIYTKDYLYIDDELELFSNVKGREFFSSCNKVLLTKSRDKYIEDTFEHEQNLIIKNNSKIILIAGCAHNGIVNIINHFNKICSSPADYIIGGFHLYNYSAKQSEDPKTVNQIAKILNETKANYYTGHCTGPEAFKQLKEIMEDKIQYLATGSVVEI
ncbi:MBL fold metallo-hydrolase [Anaerovorax odorimutans]|uniref:MBL fold metallo-hydrolase n=1 Tax=Anaerovorax odorimutans TaxID=109327 RepID=UPI00042312BE|nr:MBL fold metallo-hydrolase [Anaerovorax odorimutans]